MIAPKPLEKLANSNRNLWYGAKAVAETLLWAVATPVAFMLRYDGGIPATALIGVALFSLASLLLKGVAVSYFALNTQAWHRPNIGDLKKLAISVAVVTLIQLVVLTLFQPAIGLPRSVPFVDATIGFLLLLGLRLAVHHYFDWLEAKERPETEGTARKVLVVGAGDAGSLVVKEMLRHPGAGLQPIGFVDDDPTLSRLKMHGVPVLGTVDSLTRVIDEYEVDQVLIAAPSADGRFIRRVLELMEDSDRKVEHKVLPGVYELLSGDVSVSRVRDVGVDDLLRRPAVNLNLKAIADYVDDEVVLVTGAGGSIGSELVRQLCTFSPAKLLLLGRGENSIYEIERELLTHAPDTEYETIIANVADESRLSQVFERYQPTVVFHAAAHKHVPLMERNPEEAILNNVLGTRNVATLAREYGVKRFVNVSTDKAVNPSSIMGASKRLAEYVVSDVASTAAEDQRFVTVRFGNVLGSRGSVVPLFLRQIRDNKPVTVTHPEMTRYFMTIPEAAQLVLQAGGLAQNGAIYILDMGEPVKVVELAEDLIRLSGLEPNIDVPIVFTGTRPGEKVHEELMTEAEHTGATAHEKIFIGRSSTVDPNELQEALSTLERASLLGLRDVVKAELSSITGLTSHPLAHNGPVQTSQRQRPGYQLQGSRV